MRDLTVRLPVGKRGYVDAVRGVTLAIRRGERVGLVGESGAGKSVTGRAIAGLLPDSKRVAVSGSICLEGQEMVAASSDRWRAFRRGRLGFIFQDPLTYLNPTMTVGRQIGEALPHLVAGPESGRRPQAVEDLLAQVDLAPSVGAMYPFQLSGGMRQRVLCAIALSGKPKLLIADEPTTALDTTVQKKVLRCLDENVTSSGMALLLISHDLGVVASLCDRVYVLYQGRVLESGKTATIFASPNASYTRRLVEASRLDSHAGHTEALEAAESARDSQANQEMTRLVGHNLTKTFVVGASTIGRRTRCRAVHGVDIQAGPGEFVAVVGETGSGKSTVARMMLGLIEPSDGTVEYGGRLRKEFTKAERHQFRRDVQCILQDSAGSLNPRKRVIEALGEVARHHYPQLSKREVDTMCREHLELVGLEATDEFLRRYPYELSGGQRQRVSICRAVIPRPQLIVADEPLASLDVAIKQSVLNLLERLGREMNVGYLFITHDLPVIWRRASYVYVMKDGDVVEEGPPAILRERPKSSFTKDLLDSSLDLDTVMAQRQGSGGMSPVTAG